MIKTRKYAIIILLYALAQFTSTLIIGIPKSLAVYLSFIAMILSFLYFSETKLILEWILAITIPLIILFAVIVMVSIYIPDYEGNYSIVRISNVLFVYIFPMLVFFSIFGSFHSWIIEISQKQIYDRSIKLISVVYKTTAYIYGLINMFCMGMSLFQDHITYFDVILIYSPLLIYFLLPLPLTIHAHINKRNIEKYFHLLYMVFAPLLLLFLYYGYDTATKDIDSIVFLTMIIVILSIPLLFVLRNCYLWYRDHKRKQAIREDKD